MIKNVSEELFERMPGFGALLEKIPEALDDRELERVKAIIQSMTKQERRDPDVINNPDPPHRQRLWTDREGCQ